VTQAEFCRPTIRELASQRWDGLAPVRLRRQGKWIAIQPDDHLQLGDEIYAYGSAEFFRRGIDRLGDEISIAPDVELSSVATQVVVARREVIGRTLGELDLAREHGVVVIEVRRDGLVLPLSPKLPLQRADVLRVVGPVIKVNNLANVLGPVEPNATETDMMTFALGIAIGSAIGLLSITIAGVKLGLGAAGGLLISGMTIGWLHGTRPSVGKFPGAARWILMEFGLLLFICAVGLQAGKGVVDAFQQTGPVLLLAAAIVVSLPVIGGYLFGRKVLRLHPALLMGALTGAMTSTPALSLLTSEAKSAAPALGYTGTYAFANVFLTICGTLVMLI
jgi:putative transport protein